MSYEVVRRRGTAGRLHGLDLPDPVVPTVWWHDLAAPALVLGSTTDPAVVDQDACAQAGVEIVRRRSGGGAVLLVPAECTWIDVIIPAGSDGWADDIHLPMVWFGRHLAESMEVAMKDAAGGPERNDVRFHAHDGRLVETPWSKLVCFDGLGPGEVLADGVKLVGISQRRTRDAARLQVSWNSSYDPAVLPSLLRPQHRPPVDELRPVATLDRRLSTSIIERLVATLP
jgi:lipoate---protein ligase